jgi:hypothetical protein
LTTLLLVHHHSEVAANLPSANTSQIDEYIVKETTGSQQIISDDIEIHLLYAVLKQELMGIYPLTRICIACITVA